MHTTLMLINCLRQAQTISQRRMTEDIDFAPFLVYQIKSMYIISVYSNVTRLEIVGIFFNIDCHFFVCNSIIFFHLDKANGYHDTRALMLPLMLGSSIWKSIFEVLQYKAMLTKYETTVNTSTRARGGEPPLMVTTWRRDLFAI